jgi:hypothetical protein
MIRSIAASTGTVKRNFGKSEIEGGRKILYLERAAGCPLPGAKQTSYKTAYDPTDIDATHQFPSHCGRRHSKIWTNASPGTLQC